MPKVCLQNNKTEQAKRTNIAAQKGWTDVDSLDNSLECKEEVY